MKEKGKKQKRTKSKSIKKIIDERVKAHSQLLRYVNFIENR